MPFPQPEIWVTRPVAELVRTFDAEAHGLDPKRLERDVALAPFTTFRIGGPADLLYTADSAEDLARAVTAARAAGLPSFVLGLGANILVGDRGIRGMVIRNRALKTTWHANGLVDVETGVVVADLIQDAVRRGWSGLEHYVGIPSTVGGAVWQNLHFLSPAPERERTMFIAEVFRSCDILSAEGDRRTVNAGYVNFGYDDSVFHHRDDIALSVQFQLEAGDSSVMHRIMQENLAWRGGRHPWLQIHPSAGSIFKKLEGVGAGRLVDQCGLKGYRVGDAQISHIHANIVVNLGRATATDVQAVIAHAQQTVHEKFGHNLEVEIGRIGEF